MARGPQGELVELGTATVTLNASGAGSQAVSFLEPFVSTPTIAIASPAADAGTYTATSTTKSGLTVTVATSDLVSQDVRVTWLAVERP